MHISFSPLTIIGCITAILILGFIRIWRRGLKIKEEIDFAADFREKLFEYYNSRGTNLEAYQWLVFNSHRMQAEMGGFGMSAYFTVRNTRYANFPVILNLIPELRRNFEDDAFFSMLKTAPQSFNFIDESLIRYFGGLSAMENNASVALRNPVIWLREGIRLLCLLPFQLLYWFGLIGGTAVDRLEHSRVFKFISSVAGLIGFISAIIGIGQGWSWTMAALKNLLLHF